MTDFSKIKILFDVKSSNGFSEDEIEDILNLVNNLPRPIIDYYKELGNCDFNYWQDNLIRSNGKKLYQYKIFLNDKYVIICCENQGVCYAGIKKEDLSKENPPVYFSFDRKFWKIGCDNLIDYIHGFTYVHAALYLKNNGYLSISDNGKFFIRENFKNKRVIFYNWILDGYNTEFYGDYDDTILMLTERELFYASNNKEHFIEMENKWKGIDLENG